MVFYAFMVTLLTFFSLVKGNICFPVNANKDHQHALVFVFVWRGKKKNHCVHLSLQVSEALKTEVEAK